MSINMKEVASLRGNDKLYEENASKIDWSGALGKEEKHDTINSKSSFYTESNTIITNGLFSKKDFEKSLLETKSFFHNHESYTQDAFLENLLFNLFGE